MATEGQALNRGDVFEEDLDTFLEERRDALETVAEGDYPFSDRAEIFLERIDGGDD